MKAFLLAVLLASAGTVAEARDTRMQWAHRHTDRESMIVRYGDLDLDHEAGATVMLRRLNRAAEQVCGGRPWRVPISVRREWNSCRDETMTAAVEQLNAPMVSMVYRTKPRALFAALD